MKKAIARVLLAFLLISMLYSTEQTGQLLLPFRVMGEKPDAVELAKSDVRLIINGHPTEVIRLTRQERSLAQTPDLGRNFILSFHITNVPQGIVNGISYFVSEILSSGDVLILLTPIKAYRIPVSIDKEKMIMDIIELVKKDTSFYIKERVSAEKYLENEIDRLSTILSGPSGNAPAKEASNLTENSIQASDLAANYKGIYQFLLNFPKHISNFKDQYLLPNIVKHQEINKLLGKRHGERWWIHFQHREDVQIIHKANAISRKLNGYVSSHESGTLARTMSKELSDLEKQLLISDSVPQDDISDTLQKGNICYNVVYWGTLKTSEPDSFAKETSDLENSLRKISASSGGITVVTTDPESGLMAIKDHTDRFFEIIFEHNGNIEEKKIQVLTEGKKIPLSYKQQFSKEEVEEWISTHMEKTVEIGDFVMENNTLHFVLHSFQKDQENKYGVLKVRVSLHDGQNTAVYKSENTLRAAKERVSISIPLPEEYRGEFRLLISVFDLLANTVASYEHNIRIN